MADVTFTIRIRDDGTPVIHQIRQEAAKMGNDLDAAARRANNGLGAMRDGLGTLKSALAGIGGALGR